MVAQSNESKFILPDNEYLARCLEETADLLEGQDANPYRVRAYRTAAERIRALERPAYEILRSEGRKGLKKLPGIGEGLSQYIEQLILTGRFGLLDELRGEAGAEAVLTTVAGIGPELAGRIYRQLGIDSLEELERAAHDGRLASVPGLGPRRVRAIRESLAGRLGWRRSAGVSRAASKEQPSVEELLDVDRGYREKSAAGKLKRIAPRRFNPTGEAWLPVLHTNRGKRQYTALFSNTAQAHELGRTNDWVVIYRDDNGGQSQWTVVTAPSGDLRGRRVVRGREQECREYYASREGKVPAGAGEAKRS